MDMSEQVKGELSGFLDRLIDGVLGMIIREQIASCLGQPFDRSTELWDLGNALAGSIRAAGDRLELLEVGATWLNLNSDSPTIRHVLQLAGVMEVKLGENRHKGDAEGWRQLGVEVLIEKLEAEVAELKEAVRSRDPRHSPRDGWREAADVANLAMMIADTNEVVFAVEVLEARESGDGIAGNRAEG